MQSDGKANITRTRTGQAMDRSGRGEEKEIKAVTNAKPAAPVIPTSKASSPASLMGG